MSSIIVVDTFRPAPEPVEEKPGAHMVIRSYEPAKGPSDPPQIERFASGASRH